MGMKKILCAALAAVMLMPGIPNTSAQTMQEAIDEKTEKLLLFEDNFNDEKGTASPTVKGSAPTFAAGQSGMGAVFKTGSGYLDFEEYIGSKTTLKNKSIAFSLKSSKLHPSYDPAILSNSNWNKVDTAGFTFAYEYNKTGQYKARISNGSSKTDATAMTHSAQVWQNYVISFDDTNKKMLIYCDGELLRTMDYSTLGSGACENTKYTLKLGNDGTGAYSYNKTVDYEFVIDNFMITSSLLTEEEIAYINQTHPGPAVEREVNIQSVNAENIPAEGYANFNIYVLGEVSDAVSTIEFDAEYDPQVLEYERAQFNNTTVTKTGEGKLHISSAKAIASSDIKNYSASRFVQLVFKTGKAKNTLKSALSFTNAKAKTADGSEPENILITPHDAEFTVYPQNAADLNGDGMIGIGDVALASEEDRATVAQMSEIHPYKRAIAITIDGGGNVWDENNAPYNGKGITSSGAKIEGAGFESVRQNPYCMVLFNSEAAMSNTALSMNPPISAQNYCSILHGVTFSKLPSAYQYTNDTAGAKQWADFGLSEPAYPSALRVLNMSDPSRKLYAYAEWHPITNGIIEQNSGAYVDYNYGSYCFDRIAEYIKSGNMKNTVMSFMQSDVMDHYGHESGYFTDGYYELLSCYDGFFETMINALKEQGLYEDTLIIVNSDHGGHNYWNSTNNKMQGTHSQYSEPDDRNVFIAALRQTVNKGAKLSGGSNDDIAALMLDGLRLDKPSSMSDSTVFDKNMFLSQEQLEKRGIEKITAQEDGDTLRLGLSNAEHDIKAADIVIDTELDISQIDGARVLKNVRKDKKLYLTLAFEGDTAADIRFSETLFGRAKVWEIMLADSEGNEIYCDLENKTETPRASDILDRLSPSRAMNLGSFEEYTSAGFSFKNNTEVLSEEGAAALADISYESDGIRITKKNASQRFDFETAFKSEDNFGSQLYTLEFDIEQINAAQMYISTKWRNFITLNWLSDGTIDINAGKGSLSGYKNKRVKFKIVMNYEDGWADIYADGVLVVEKCALRDDASGAYTPSKPMTLNINMTDTGASGSGMKLYYVSLTEHYASGFKLTDTQGYIVHEQKPGDEVMAISQKSLYKSGGGIYLAAYDGNGRLLRVEKTDMSPVTNTSTGAMTVPEGGYVKAMLWDENMRIIE